MLYCHEIEFNEIEFNVILHNFSGKLAGTTRVSKIPSDLKVEEKLEILIRLCILLEMKWIISDNTDSLLLSDLIEDTEEAHLYGFELIRKLEDIINITTSLPSLGFSRGLESLF